MLAPHIEARWTRGALPQAARTYFLSSGGAASRLRYFDWDRARPSSPSRACIDSCPVATLTWIVRAPCPPAPPLPLPVCPCLRESLRREQRTGQRRHPPLLCLNLTLLPPLSRARLH